MKSTYRHNA